MSLPCGTLSALWMAVSAILLPPGSARADQAICLRAHPADTLLQVLDLPRDNSFSLGFIHSVSRTPVRDIYTVRAGAIVQTSEIFEAHGAGLPSMADELNATAWRHENGHFILDMDRPIGSMIVRIQAAYDNTLRIGEHTLLLATLGQSALRISACARQDHS